MGYKTVVVLKDSTIMKKEFDLIMEALEWLKIQVELQRIRNMDTLMITEVK
jgi:hypothetical protein